MAKTELTLVLNGHVSLENYAKAMSSFKKLISNLQKQHAKKISINWEVQNLESGSARATVNGEVEDISNLWYIEKIVKDYENIGEKSERGLFSELPKYAKKPIEELTSIINGKIPSIRLETVDRDFSISTTYSENQQDKPPANIPSTYFDTVIGRVQNLFKEPSYRFTLYERFRNKPVSCFLNPNYEDIMRDAWGKYAIVEGMVKISSSDGLPETIRDIKKVEVYHGESGFWRDAIGAANGVFREMSPEDFVRNTRDE